MSYASLGRGLTKPPVGAQVRWGHPLSVGLVAAYPMHERGGDYIYDLVTGNRVAFFNNTPEWVGDDLKFLGSSSSYATTAGGPNLANKPFSVVMGAKDITTTATSAHFSVGSSATTSNHIIIRVTSATSVIFSLWFNDLTSTVPSITGRRVHWAATMNDALLQSFYDGGVLANSRTSSSYFTGTQTLWFNMWASTLNTPGITFEYVYLYDRALSANEAAWIAAEPYAMLAQTPYRRYFTAPVAAPDIDKWLSFPPQMPIEKTVYMPLS